MKTIILFVLGLLSWLVLTNYQLVYSKVINFTNPDQEPIEVTSSINSSTKETIEEDLSTESSKLVKEDILESESPEPKLASEKPTHDANLDIENDIETASSENSAPSQTTAEQAKPKMDSGDASASQMPKNHPWMQPHSVLPMFNQGMMSPGMMDPHAMMNPMAMMMPMMNMMNPAMMMNPQFMMNHPLNTMTHPQNMNAMMMSMDPKLMFSMFGQPGKEYQDGEVPEHLPVVSIPGFPTQDYQDWPINKVSPGISREAKKNAFQTAMAASPLGIRDMLGIMTDKMPVADDVSWDDAVEAMKLRANEVNFKFVGSSPLWKEIEAVTGEPSAKVEMFRFCDARIARNILDVVPEFIIFLPCKIALLEDGEGKLWVMTMDWDVAWLDYAQNPNNHLPKSIREDAQKIRDNLHYIMEGAATGDF